jgi:hypothetical protein
VFIHGRNVFRMLYHRVTDRLLFISWSAAKYGNEAEVGDALAEAFQTGLVNREDLFITTKVNLSSTSQNAMMLPLVFFLLYYWKIHSIGFFCFCLFLVEILAGGTIVS